MTVESENINRPKVTREEALEFVGLEALEVKELVSYDDINFHVKTKDGEYTVKIHKDSFRSISNIEYQHEIMRCLGKAGISCPQPLQLKSKDGINYHILSWVHGELYKFGKKKPAELLRNVGRLCAQVERALKGFDNPEGHWEWDWDIKRVEKVVTGRFHYVKEDDTKQLLQRLIARNTECMKGYEAFPHSIIHSDLNDTNILIGNNAVTGVLDFGDCIWSPTLFEVGICACYWALEEPEWFEPAGNVVKGYQEEMGSYLSDAELKLIYGAALGRMLVSVIMAFQSAAQQPDNVYAAQTAKPGLVALRQHDNVSFEQALALLKQHST